MVYQKQLVVVLAPAKLNLSLDVAGLLPNGYHDLDMVMQTIDLYERITLRRSADLTLRLPGILGEREIRVNRIDQLPGLLQGMFPDIVPEPDVWGIWKLGSAVPEQADAVHSLTL